MFPLENDYHFYRFFILSIICNGSKLSAANQLLNALRLKESSFFCFFQLTLANFNMFKINSNTHSHSSLKIIIPVVYRLGVKQKN